jgi:hypothetical protein
MGLAVFMIVFPRTVTTLARGEKRFRVEMDTALLNLTALLGREKCKTEAQPDCVV